MPHKKETVLPILPYYHSTEELIADTSNKPMNIRLSKIQTMISKLDDKKAQTRRSFSLLQVHDEIPEGILDERAQFMLQKMPGSVFEAEDTQIGLYQVTQRNDKLFLEVNHPMRELTTLFIVRYDQKGACFFLPDDPASQTNWQTLQEFYRQITSP